MGADFTVFPLRDGTPPDLPSTGEELVKFWDKCADELEVFFLRPVFEISLKVFLKLSSLLILISEFFINQLIFNLLPRVRTIVKIRLKIRTCPYHNYSLYHVRYQLSKRKILGCNNKIVYNPYITGFWGLIILYN